MTETDRNLRILVLGCGSIGERHVRCFLATGRCQIGICEINDALRHAVAARYGIERCFASLAEALAQGWDAAVIATPAHLHVAQALEIAGRRIALHIEKPLSTSLRQVDALQRVVDRAALVVNIAYVYRAHPAVAEMKRLITTGEIGDVHQLRFASGQDFATLRPAYRDIYYKSRATGGGAIQDSLTHEFNLAQHLLGRFDWIFADWAHQQLAGVAVEDTVNVLGRLRGGRTMVSFTSNQFMAPNEYVIEAHGELGSIRFEATADRLGVLMKGDKEWRTASGHLAGRDDLFTRQANAFLDAVEKRAPPLCALDEAVHTLRVNLAALHSGVTRLPVAIDALDESLDAGSIATGPVLQTARSQA